MMTDDPLIFGDEEYEMFHRCCACAVHLDIGRADVGLCVRCLGDSVWGKHGARAPIPFAEWWGRLNVE